MYPPPHLGSVLLLVPLIVIPLLIGPLPVQEKPESGAAALGLENVGGIFLVLVVGLSLSCLVATIEYAWSRRRLTRSNVSTCSTLPQYRTPVQYLSGGALPLLPSGHHRVRLEQAQAHPL
jgi:hypothetical protein